MRFEIKRPLRKTLLAVGEGKADVAFLKHLRRLYCIDGKGTRVTIKDAHGKGPGNVISTAVGALRIAAYDKRLCLLDTDLDWTNQNKHEAKKHKIILVGSKPCLEGLLLQILKKPVPNKSLDCKHQLRSITLKDMLQAEDFEQFFHYQTLQSARMSHSELHHLITLFYGSG